MKYETEISEYHRADITDLLCEIVLDIHLKKDIDMKFNQILLILHRYQSLDKLRDAIQGFVDAVDVNNTKDNIDIIYSVISDMINITKYLGTNILSEENIHVLFQPTLEGINQLVRTLGGGTDEDDYGDFELF